MIFVYANDKQIHKSVDARDVSYIVSSLENCNAELRKWMIPNKLKLDDDETEILLLDSKRKQ